jgi:hypothetical protein
MAQTVQNGPVHVRVNICSIGNHKILTLAVFALQRTPTLPLSRWHFFPPKAFNFLISQKKFGSIYMPHVTASPIW